MRLRAYADIVRFRHGKGTAQAGVARQEGNDSYDNWIREQLDDLSNCSYFTRSYEFIDGKLLYCENFKDAGLKFYFNNGYYEISFL